MTDWDAYYLRPYASARVSRGFTSRLLIRLMRRYLDPTVPAIIVELGGGNSSFMDNVLRSFRPREYHVVDNNELGLELLRERLGPNHPGVLLHRQDVLQLGLQLRADLVFSVGLIEHFTGSDLAAVIGAHFGILKDGGIALITFPTPTPVYRVARRISEAIGAWIFHDETALPVGDVEKLAMAYGRVLKSQLHWPVVFTQAVIVIRKSLPTLRRDL